MTLATIFLILALVMFTLGAARVPAAINWTDAGFAFVVAAVLAGGVVLS